MMALLRCPLQSHEVVEADGFRRASVQIPIGAQILHLGSEPPNNIVSMFILAPLRPPGPGGKPKPYEPHELATFEFIVLMPGNIIPPKGYVFRAPVRMDNGLMFLFEKQSTAGKILVPGGLG